MLDAAWHWNRVYKPTFYTRVESPERVMTKFVKVARADEIGPGQALLIDVEGKQIALFNVNGEFFALDNMCTHEEASLAEGEISGHEVTCPLHGAKFDIRSGEVLGPPAYDDVARYGVRVMGTDVEVEVE
jgi:3-phenylpropionate/trans-cinnamate dioxygenase ferredoxin subunit